MIERVINKNISKKLYVALLVAIVLARLAIAISQRVFLMPDGAGLDDGLMFAAAQAIVNGEWLGTYTAFTMAKTMGFSLWLALVHVLGVPYLVANAALWLLCSAFAAWAFRPVLEGNLIRAIVFALFAFLPTGFASFTLRVYRDSIFSAFCMLVFAGALALAFRAKETKQRGRWCAAAGLGIGLAGVFLLREDGLLLLPFAVCALGLLLLYALKNKEVIGKKQLLLQCLLPFVMLAAGVFSFSAVNYAQYGVWMVNDNTQGSFPKAYGAIVAVAEAESEFQQLVPVSNEALARLLEEVPSLTQLAPSLEEGPVYNGFYNKELGGYGGSFYYALRLAADLQGLMPDAQSAQMYWQQVYEEIQQAVDEGRLESTKPSQSTVPGWQASLLLPTVQEFFFSLKMTLLFEGIEQRPILSENKYEDGVEMAAWLNTVPQEPVYEAGSEQLYYNVFQKAVFFFCDVLIWVYRLLIWPLLLVAVVQCCKGIRQGVRTLIMNRFFSMQLFVSALMFGLVLSYALRLGVAAYLEVAAFDVGTHLMYLASGMPALLLFCVLGVVVAGGRFAKEEAK